MKMNGEYSNVIKNVSMFDAFTDQPITFTSQVVIGGAHSNGVSWETWIAYPIILLLLLITVLIIIRQNLDRGAAFLAQLQECARPFLNLFRSDTGGADEDIEMQDVSPMAPADPQLHGRNLSDSERIRASAQSVNV